MEKDSVTAKTETTKPKDKKEVIKGKVFDYKDVETLQKYTSERGKILPRRLTLATAKEQRKLAQAIKRARFLALIAPLNR
ncbi:30S ribosomal protein S18 [Candidatus Hepatincola sp. Pdp]